MPKKIQLIGFEKVEGLLKEMDGKLTQKVIEGTFRKAAKPLIRSARQKAPEGPTGNLKKSIGVFPSKSSQRRAKEMAGIWVGPRLGKAYKGYHAHLIEFGTKDRTPKKGQFLVFEYQGRKVFAKRAKGISPKPFMQPAYNETYGEMVVIIEDEVENVFKKVYDKYKG